MERHSKRHAAKGTLRMGNQLTVDCFTRTDVQQHAGIRILLGEQPHLKVYFRFYILNDRLCDLVVRVSGYRSRGPVFDFRRYQILWEVVGLERGPLSLVSTTEELLGR
jgi:hypothetical protein